MDCREYKIRFIEEIQERSGQTKASLIEKFSITIQESNKLYEIINEQLSKHYKTVQEYINLQMFLQSKDLKVNMKKMKIYLQIVDDIYNSLTRYQILVH